MSNVREVQLTLYQPQAQPVLLSLPADRPITLGRAPDCTIPITGRFMSRHHAEILLESSDWFVRDCGSVNGTLLNGVRLTTAPTPLHAGDRIGVGDSEILFHGDERPSQIFAVDSLLQAKHLEMSITDALNEGNRGQKRASMLTELALEFIEDRELNALFDFILDRVNALLAPSRAALALLAPDGKSFSEVRLRRRDSSESADLTISKTLLGEVVEERKVVSFLDTSLNEKLSRAESIIAQQIRSAVCAPLVIGDAVLGVLYLDFLANRGAVTHDDVTLIAQIARFAAAKLETTRLRQEAITKAKMEEELRTAYTIQSRLLPASLPKIDGYGMAGLNRPCRTVSGDYYDVVVRPSGHIYFIVADVSGKGITAALVMSGLATAFNIFTRTDPSAASLVTEINETLAPKTAPSKFATLIAGFIDPATGIVHYANAGHVAPLVVRSGGVEKYPQTDMVVGLFAGAKYHEQSIELGPGDTLVMFTDGVTEAENEQEEELGLSPVIDLLEESHGEAAERILERIESHVKWFIGPSPAGDDVTMFAINRAK